MGAGGSSVRIDFWSFLFDGERMDDRHHGRNSRCQSSVTPQPTSLHRKSMQRAFHCLSLWFASCSAFWATNPLMRQSSSTKFQFLSNTSDDIMDKTVIVIGAGLAGLAVSIGLSDLGYKVEIVEKQETFARRGATLGLKPNGIKALDELDKTIMQDLSKIGIGSPGDGYMLPWFTVRDAILHYVQDRSESIKLHMGWSLQSFYNEPDSVEAVFLDSDKNKVSLQGTMLIGCDGVHSTVRELLDLPAAVFCGTKYWRSSIKVPLKSPRLQKELAKPPMTAALKYGETLVSLFNFHSKLPNILGWSVATKDSSVLDGSHPWTVLKHPDIDNETQMMLQELFEHTNQADLTHVWEVRTTDPSGTWGGDNRVILIGDAAHAIRPVSGVGASLAFEDCVVLCRELKTSRSLSECVKKTIAKRQQRVAKIWKTEWDLAEAYYQNRPAELSPAYIQWLHDGV